MGFWNKSLGEVLNDRAETKAGADRPKKYQPQIFGTMKTGYVELKRDGRMSYRDTEHFKPTEFHVGDIASIEIEDASELDRRMSVARTGGGALVGGVLLGPVGLLAGLGLGALAKKQHGGEKFLVIELADERTIIAEVARKNVTKAHALRNQLRESR